MTNTNQLIDRIEMLEERVQSLQGTIQRLAISSIPNPKYPYWHMIITMGISEEKKSDLEFVLLILSDRLSGNKIVVNPNNNITDEMFTSEETIITFSKASRFPDALVRDTPPVWEESLKIISFVLEIPYEETIKKILLAMREQSMFKSLINHLLNQNNV